MTDKRQHAFTCRKYKYTKCRKICCFFFLSLLLYFQYNGNNGRKLSHPLSLTFILSITTLSVASFPSFHTMIFVLFNYFLLLLFFCLFFNFITCAHRIRITVAIALNSLFLSLVTRKMQTIWLYLAHIVFVDLDETMAFFYDSSSTGCASITVIFCYNLIVRIFTVGAYIMQIKLSVALATCCLH